MQYILGLIIGLIVEIICFSLWKKEYGKYLPLEDALLLKVIFGSVLTILGLICGLISSFLNKYTILAALIIYALVLLISILFGIYYKTIATKKNEFLDKRTLNYTYNHQGLSLHVLNVYTPIDVLVRTCCEFFLTLC